MLTGLMILVKQAVLFACVWKMNPAGYPVEHPLRLFSVDFYANHQLSESHIKFKLI